MSESTIATIIAAGATVLVALVTILPALILSRKPVKVAAPQVDMGEGEEPFHGTNDQLVQLMWKDYKGLQSQVSEVPALKETIEDLRREVQEIRDQYGSLVGAIRRYIQKLANSWHARGTEPFPPPDEIDFDILQHALPREHHRK